MLQGVRTAPSRHVRRVIRNTFLERSRSRWLAAATYAQRIKNKAAGKASKTRKSAPPADAKAASAAPKPAPAAPPKPAAAAAPPVATGELQRLKDELQRVNQEISRLARASRPDATRQSSLPEKQELLRQKAVLDARVRAASKT